MIVESPLKSILRNRLLMHQYVNMGNAGGMEKRNEEERWELYCV